MAGIPSQYWTAGKQSKSLKAYFSKELYRKMPRPGVLKREKE
jgi:hypothetical protein